MSENVETRLDRLESLVEQQQETIERQRERIAALDGVPDSDGSAADEDPIVSRRDALKAGGLLGLLGMGAGTASADAQGQIGTSSDPLEAVYTEELNGGVTGGQAVQNLFGDGLTFANNDVTAALGDGLGFDGSNRIEVPADAIDSDELVNDSVTVAGNAVSLGGSTGVDYVDLGDTGSSFPISNSDLANDSVTVSAGNGLQNGGSVSLGNTTTLDVGLSQVGSGTGVLAGVTSDNIKHRSLSGANGVTVSENSGTVTVGAGQTGVTTNTANSFTEGGVTVNTTRASVSGGAVRAMGSTSTASRPSDDSTLGSSSEGFGLKIQANSDLVALVATVSSNTSGASTVKLTDSGLNTLQSKSFPGAGNTVRFDFPFTSGSSYYVLVDGSGYKPGYLSGGSFPYSSQYVDITATRKFQGGAAPRTVTSDPYCIQSIKGVASSEATIEFGDPTPVSRWETVTFQSRAGGGSVDVAVEVDDGGWTFWDYVGPGTDLSAIPTDQNVRLRAELDPTTASDEPRLTFANRQYRP